MGLIKFTPEDEEGPDDDDEDEEDEEVNVAKEAVPLLLLVVVVVVVVLVAVVAKAPLAFDSSNEGNDTKLPFLTMRRDVHCIFSTFLFCSVLACFKE